MSEEESTIAKLWGEKLEKCPSDLDQQEHFPPATKRTFRLYSLFPIVLNKQSIAEQNTGAGDLEKPVKASTATTRSSQNKGDDLPTATADRVVRAQFLEHCDVGERRYATTQLRLMSDANVQKRHAPALFRSMDPADMARCYRPPPPPRLQSVKTAVIKKIECLKQCFFQRRKTKTSITSSKIRHFKRLQRLQKEEKVLEQQVLSRPSQPCPGGAKR